MLIVSCGGIVFTRRMTPSKDCVHVVKVWRLLFRLDSMNLYFHLASFRQTDWLGWTKYTVLVDCMNIVHDKNSLG
jgi:hypothetical protein